MLGPDHSCCSSLDSLINPLPLQSVMLDANNNNLGQSLLVLSTVISYAFQAIFLVLHPREIYSILQILFQRASPLFPIPGC